MPDDKPLEFRRDDDYASLYANNIQFEASVWDLKIIFGQLDQARGETVIDQHTAVSISWMQAKLAAYFMVANIMIHQSKLGPILTPDLVLPKRPDSSEPGIDEESKKLFQYLAWVHDQFFGANPYIPPTTPPAGE